MSEKLRAIVTLGTWKNLADWVVENTDLVNASPPPIFSEEQVSYVLAHAGMYGFYSAPLNSGLIDDILSTTTFKNKILELYPKAIPPAPVKSEVLQCVVTQHSFQWVKDWILSNTSLGYEGSSYLTGAPDPEFTSVNSNVYFVRVTDTGFLWGMDPFDVVPRLTPWEGFKAKVLELYPKQEPVIEEITIGDRVFPMGGASWGPPIPVEPRCPLRPVCKDKMCPGTRPARIFCPYSFGSG